MSDKPQSSSSGPIVAAIDAGGTTFKCALIQGGKSVLANLRVPTTRPAETLQACAEFFQAEAANGLKPNTIGIASFGPLDVDSASADYGSILEGPKSAWAGTNLRTYFENALSLPVAVDTDVNGALLAERAYGAAKGSQSAAYVTIGTGIGAGVFANGDLVGKPAHPEFGHIYLKRHPADTDFKGVCATHGDCLEGLASATAFMKRYGDPKVLPLDHIGWEVEAFYLAQACQVLSLSLRPNKIILGGGLMLAPNLISKVRDEYARLINGYLRQSAAEIEDLIVTPALGDDAGIFGGYVLGENLLKSANS